MITIVADLLLTTKQNLPALIRPKLNGQTVLITGFPGHGLGHEGLADPCLALQEDRRVLANAIGQSL